MYSFDVIVVGGGHAGIEAAHAAAKMGSKTLLLTLDIQKIGLMPCNPSIGGIGKGHIVYEISALGGLMPKLCTKTYLQARMLNTKKGPAVQGLRLQIDKYAYSDLSKKTLENIANLSLRNGMVDHLVIDGDNNIRGVITNDGITYHSSQVILTTGTFLNGLVHIGTTNFPAGRQGESAVASLSQSLAQLNLRMGRLKTGTPPRLLKSSIDFSRLDVQEPDSLEYLFEFQPHKSTSTHACYITHTNERTHEIIRNNLHQSAMYSGNIKGIGPRYCPSIEDKISRFADKTSHHIFVEPEGADVDEIYPSGISTSLPIDIQKQYIQTIRGFENAIITKPGYAVEYDFVLPDQLYHTMEVKSARGLYLAGQINGTTGYEEAAGQGIIAGINASLRAQGKEPFIVSRTDSYIGVMIDDLVTMSVDEPYRMFTSRAERRLSLRQDNAFLRLTDRAYSIGMIEDDLYSAFIHEKQIIEQTLIKLKTQHTCAQLLRIFGELECNREHVRTYAGCDLSERAIDTIYASIRYEPYLKREERDIERYDQYQELLLPAEIDFTHIPGLSKELAQKLTRHRPLTIAQACLIPGMTPAAISLLILQARKK
ncbi:tRNA uridine-5-carboxymethylaminomethyl(34) synthesis enzyme MnmG [Vermiphilus pyriformis]|nr:MAG: tRNA uridine-5-carboxymethylaminomethyl(34) synthesis enzyme MnmG [Vermiphilus pyriformis]